MANAERGEVSFDVDGKTWTMRYSANALCELEDLLDLGTAEIVARLQDPKGVRMKLVRALMWAGLHDRHPEMELSGAGDLISELGFDKATALIGDAAAKAFPPPPASDNGEGPRKGEAAGSGKIS